MNRKAATRTPRCWNKDYVVSRVFGPGRTKVVAECPSRGDAVAMMKAAVEELESTKTAEPAAFVIVRRSTGTLEGSTGLDQVV